MVGQGATRTLNPSLPQRVVDRALEKDRARATAEYLAEFRTDVEGVAVEIVEACTGDYREMLPAANNFYRAFTDPSGGSDDSFALAISHKSEDRIIIDAIREVRPPFSPDSAATTRACFGCRALTTTRPGSAPVFKPTSTAGDASDYDGVLRALSR